VSAAATVLAELVTNVERHVPGSTAWISVTLEPRYFPSIRIAVCDNGPGIDEDILYGQYKAVAAGEREHGLMNVLRLANESYVQIESPPSNSHCAVYQVYDPPPARSVLLDYPFVAPIRVEWVWPKLFRIGDDVYAVGPNSLSGFEIVLSLAVEKESRAVLDPYFKPLCAGASLLGVEVTGMEIPTEQPPGVFERLQQALELYFPAWFRDKRVVILAHDTQPFISDECADWAARWGLDFYTDERSCRERLEKLAFEQSGA
jgi:Histidine kinase-, DNA gyrase B-, and HSP90-like ATPase